MQTSSTTDTTLRLDMQHVIKEIPTYIWSTIFTFA
jgi:hypothetical protein